MLRPGAVTPQMLRELLPDLQIHQAVTEKLQAGVKASSPGMKYKHYAPKAQITILDADSAQFVAYVRQVRQAYSIAKIINGTQNWPDKPEERDVLYFLAQSFRAQLLKELPHNRGKLTSATQTLTLRAKELLVELAGISLEIAQMAITPEDGETLPAWFIVEVTRDLPALTKKKMG